MQHQDGAGVLSPVYTAMQNIGFAQIFRIKCLPTSEAGTNSIFQFIIKTICKSISQSKSIIEPKRYSRNKLFIIFNASHQFLFVMINN